ncbi:MAG TPA: 1-deoxy-D-xylulose-5-phosphate reductoisomerase [Sphingobacteriaceae bacterium]|nr:1-deoxy-D-xylulose-5-phosphate reductoisomerase [Sphingobacteriaceae bacterium]
MAPAHNDSSVKNIAVLGSTGSIGRSTLAVVAAHPRRFRVKALAARQDAGTLYRQAEQHRPLVVALADEEAAARWQSRFNDLGVQCWAGPEALTAIARMDQVDTVVAAISGSAGLPAALAAVEAGKTVALANKEALVAAGPVFMEAVRRSGAPLLPVDSEHNALFQCLQGIDRRHLRRVVLTASGGPFFGRRREELRHVTPDQALRHPTWSMGAKITIDSATLMNKGLEVIEAMHLFDLSPEQIDVLIHPESIVHSLVETVDGGILAHMAEPDMRHAIQYSLSYPERWTSPVPRLDLAGVGSLNFALPDHETFPALGLAYDAARAGGTMPAVLNAANEVAVEAFLGGKAGFLDIPRIVEAVMAAHRVGPAADLDGILAADRWAREYADQLLSAQEGVPR